ncbi:MAG: sigma factor-like helix-turn-helix DNA-binding protein [Eubacteriales bacterium]|nr:sigma factor-like helix-turn-helix DNA-binding protein [Eubacteriales bacterium]
MDDIGRIALLLDYYGQLLTERQREAMELFYNSGLSLSEIAGQCGVTRQAVHDVVKKSCAILEAYEARLKLAGEQIARTGKEKNRQD